jgi:hypothetical protein
MMLVETDFSGVHDKCLATELEFLDLVTVIDTVSSVGRITESDSHLRLLPRAIRSRALPPRLLYTFFIMVLGCSNDFSAEYGGGKCL